ncbi:hypothetical protein F5I97DRAFT_246091 [Phlebopus sp. FC_14]|nr:hypothetical protein F5I97DRAFT_246091 [Phlebopus sp. FC_14]
MHSLSDFSICRDAGILCVVVMRYLNIFVGFLHVEFFLLLLMPGSSCDRSFRHAKVLTVDGFYALLWPTQEPRGSNGTSLSLSLSLLLPFHGTSPLLSACAGSPLPSSLISRHNGSRRPSFIFTFFSRRLECSGKLVPQWYTIVPCPTFGEPRRVLSE